MSAGFSWNQRHTGGHRPPLQLGLPPWSILPQPVRPQIKVPSTAFCAKYRSLPRAGGVAVRCHLFVRTILVHNGVMALKDKNVRQSITLPSKIATQVRSMAKRRRLSANRMLIELVEEGLEAKKLKEKAFFELAERFRAADDPKDVERLGEELGQMVFGR